MFQKCHCLRNFIAWKIFIPSKPIPFQNCEYEGKFCNFEINMLYVKPPYATDLFPYPMKYPSGFLFSGDIERDPWHEMGQVIRPQTIFQKKSYVKFRLEDRHQILILISNKFKRIH